MPKPPELETTTSPTALAEAVLIDVGLVLLFVVLPHGVFGDARDRFEALRDLIERRTLSPMRFSFAGPLASAPFYLLGKVFFTSQWWCARFNTVLFGAGLVAARRLMRTAAEREVLRRFALLLIAASMFPNHLRNYGGEVFTAMLVAVGIVAVHAGHELAGWTAVVAGVVNTPASMVGLALMVLARRWRVRRWTHALAVPVAAALILLEAWVRRGNPWTTGYENNAGFATIMPYSGRPGFSYPFFFGILSILFSFGRGLIFFAPGLLLWIRRPATIGERLRGSYTLWMWFLVGLILVYAKWWAWYGGLSWGPRFFLFASIPAALAIAAKLHDIRGSSMPALGALLLALTLSTWVGIAGAAFDQVGLDLCSQNNYALEAACWYVPEFSVLWRPLIVGAIPQELTVIIVAYCVVVYMTLAAPVIVEIVRRAASRT